MAASPDPFPAELVAEAQAGSEAAESQILRRLEPMLRGYFIRRAGKRPEVDDLVQNTLLRVHTGLPDLIDPARLKAFTMKAALFELQDLYRGRYDAKEILYDPDLPPPAADGAAPSAAGVDVERALASLTEKARTIIELREKGYKYKEIAEMVDTTEAAVKMQVMRAFEKMRSVLTALLLALLASAPSSA